MEGRTEWHDVVAWAKLGDYAAAFKKGSHLRIEGEIRSQEFQNKDGNKQNAYEIVAASILTLRSGHRDLSLSEPRSLSCLSLVTKLSLLFRQRLTCI